MFLPDNTYFFIATFCRTANGLAALFGGPLYLVGSALYKDHPSDYDVRIPLSNEDILRRFGPEEHLDLNFTWDSTWRMYYEELKQSRRLARNGLRFVDLQFQRAEIFHQHTGARLRLDSAPEWFFSAGITNP